MNFINIQIGNNNQGPSLGGGCCPSMGDAGAMNRLSPGMMNPAMMSPGMMGAGPGMGMMNPSMGAMDPSMMGGPMMGGMDPSMMGGPSMVGGMDPTMQMMQMQQGQMQIMGQVLMMLTMLLMKLMQNGGAAAGASGGAAPGDSTAPVGSSGGGGGSPAGGSPAGDSGGGGSSPVSGSGSTGSTYDGAKPGAPGDAKSNAQIVAQVARSKGVDPVTAVAAMLVESGGNSHAVGDNGSSFGLFQLHRGGELGSMSPEQAYDPKTNAEVALSVFAKNKGKYSDPGHLAAASQRPANPEHYAQMVNAKIPEARRLLGM